MALKRPVPGSMLGPVEDSFDDSDFSTKYPTVYEYLTVTEWAPKQPRTTSTISVFVDSGVLKLCLNDRDNNRSAFFTGATFSKALQSMEDALLSERVDWRRRNGSGGSAMNTPF